jgi:hypothetical protein
MLPRANQSCPNIISNSNNNSNINLFRITLTIMGRHHRMTNTTTNTNVTALPIPLIRTNHLPTIAQVVVLHQLAWSALSELYW